MFTEAEEGSVYHELYKSKMQTEESYAITEVGIDRVMSMDKYAYMMNKNAIIAPIYEKGIQCQVIPKYV